MSERKIKIGCHVGMKAPDYLLGSLKEALSYNANAFMIFTGAPQNRLRKPVKDLKLDEFKTSLKEQNFESKNIIVHAPYLINLANTVNEKVFTESINFLQSEIKRCSEIGVEVIVLHPGSSLGVTKEVALKQLVKGLNLVTDNDLKVKIALETMAGKGNEVGSTFSELAYILNNVEKKSLIGVCWDTCHMYDAGYDIKNNLEQVITEFEKEIGIDKVFAIHLNDSLYGFNSHKDRHANLGLGKIGFDAIVNLIYHEKLKDKVQILETTYINQHPPYKVEIAMIDNKKFDRKALEDLQNND